MRDWPLAGKIDSQRLEQEQQQIPGRNDSKKGGCLTFLAGFACCYLFRGWRVSWISTLWPVVVSLEE